jgi:hypothetical protein
MQTTTRTNVVRVVLGVVGILSLVGSAAFRTPGSGWFYNGRHAREVQHLLQRVDNWKLPSCATCSDLSAPDIPINPNSTQRDAYVGTAVAYAFGAEAYAKVGKPAEAEQAAESMHKSLELANELCSPSTSAVDARGMTPATLRIWSCPAPFSLEH